MAADFQIMTEEKVKVSRDGTTRSQVMRRTQSGREKARKKGPRDSDLDNYSSTVTITVRIQFFCFL